MAYIIKNYKKLLKFYIPNPKQSYFKLCIKIKYKLYTIIYQVN